MTAPQAPSRIRAAQPEDRDAIIEVARASGPFSPDEFSEVEATLDAFLASAAADDRWLVDAGAHGAAAIAYYAPERMTDGTWNLYLLAVHPDYQGRGRGSALVRQVEQNLRRVGARVLLIETSGAPGFAVQRAFYAGLGYHEVARIREFYAAGDDKIVYWKPLRPLPSPSPVDQAGG